MKKRMFLGGALVALLAAVLATQTGATAGQKFCAPGDIEAQIEQQIAVLAALDPAPSAGVGTAKNANSNSGRFNSLQNRLRDALAALDAGDTAAALAAIASVVDKADGLSPPPDWLTGATATALSDALGCISGAIAGGGSNANLYVSISPDSV